MPINSPLIFSSGPPEFPGLMLAFVWIRLESTAPPGITISRPSAANDARGYGVAVTVRVANGDHGFANHQVAARSTPAPVISCALGSEDRQIAWSVLCQDLGFQFRSIR